MEIEATLTKLPFWDNLSEQERTLTKCGATHRTYEKGVYVFDYSDSCMGMVYIQKGSIRVFITSEEGREVTLFHISKATVVYSRLPVSSVASILMYRWLQKVK